MLLNWLMISQETIYIMVNGEWRNYNAKVKDDLTYQQGLLTGGPPHSPLFPGKKLHLIHQLISI